MGTIYLIWNDVNNKTYIGQTTQTLNERMVQHKRAKEGYLHEAMREIGFEHFHIKAIEENIPSHLLNDKEREYIEKYNSIKEGYNVLKGGKGEFVDQKLANEIKERYTKGKSITQMAKEYNVNAVTLYRGLIKQGMTFPHDGNKYEKWDDTEFKAMWNDREITRKDMAAYYSVNTMTIKRHANRLGLGGKV